MLSQIILQKLMEHTASGSSGCGIILRSIPNQWSERSGGYFSNGEPMQILRIPGYNSGLYSLKISVFSGFCAALSTVAPLKRENRIINHSFIREFSCQGSRWLL